MADLYLKQGTPTTVQSSSNSAVLANLTAVLCSTSILDNSVNLDEAVSFALTGGFGAAPTIPAGIEVYLVPAFDGTNYGDVNTTSGASYISTSQYATVLPVVLSQTANQLMTAGLFPLAARKYRVYILNRTGQQLSAGWALTLYGFRRQVS